MKAPLRHPPKRSDKPHAAPHVEAQPVAEWIKDPVNQVPAPDPEPDPELAKWRNLSAALVDQLPLIKMHDAALIDFVSAVAELVADKVRTLESPHI